MATGSPAQRYIYGRNFFDWKVISPHLPKNLKNSLHLGSGVGIFDLVMINHYHKNQQTPHFTLVDLVKRGEYNIIDVAKTVMTTNQVPAKSHRLVSAEQAQPIKDRKYDLIISLRGLAFMFPYTFYSVRLRPADADLVRAIGHLRREGLRSPEWALRCLIADS